MKQRDQKPSKQEKDYLKHNSNPFLKKLDTQRREKGISPSELSDLVGIQEATLFGKDSGFPSDPEQQTPFSRTLIARLHFILGINPADFLLSQEDEQAWLAKNPKARKSTRYFTSEYWEQLQKKRRISVTLEKIYFIDDDWSNDHSVSLEKAYKEIADTYIKRAHDRLIVHELLSKGDNRKNRPFEAYAKAQKIILNTIIQRLKQKSQMKRVQPFSYERIFFLSRSERYLKKDTRARCIEAFVIEASVQTLQHVEYCLEHYRTNCRFYVATAKSYRNQVIIDDKYLLSEDYRLHEKRIVPERLSVLNVKDNDEKGTALLKMVESHLSEHDAVYEFTPGEIMGSLESVKDHIERQMISLKSVRDNLKSQDEATEWLRKKVVEEQHTYKELLEIVNDKLKKLTKH